jgi:hypothetical protein
MGRNTGDDGLSEGEIEERNSLILVAIDELKTFDHYISCKLSLSQYMRMLTPGDPENVECVGSSITYDINWVEKKVDKIKDEIINKISTEIVAQADDLKVSDFILRGSANSVATKLSLLYFTGQRPSRHENLSSDWMAYINWYQWGQGPFRFDFDDFVKGVSELYELKCMRYRLWDKKAKDYLQQFLFRGIDYESSETGALYDPESHDIDISRSDFIALVEEEITKCPKQGNTHISFPDFNGDGVIFSEYLPFGKMDNQYIDELYQLYKESLISICAD